MIGMEEFQKIRESKHLIVLDTNILLELYRQPANISLDIIVALEQILSNIYIPRQVYDEYLRNYQAICGSEKKKYRKVSKELAESVRKLQEDISTKINEYRKHNYTDISKLQSDLNQKIGDVQEIIKNFEDSHKTEIQSNIDFLQNDKVKEFVDLLLKQGCVGNVLPFSERLYILQEGQVRFDNLIPPGFMDLKKEGVDKYGDLFVWKSIIRIAKEKHTNILFVCNDVKEDWWEKDKENPIELRTELLEEFEENNPSLDIHFLTLEKFFSYIAEELKIGKSKSALQLSAMDDVREMLDKYEDAIYQSLQEYLCSINIEEELNEEFLETGSESIYWDVADVSVEKESKSIIYYVNLDISVLTDLTYQEEGDYPYDAGKLALALNGKIELSLEEYSTNSELKALNIDKNDILHIEPEIWKMLSPSMKGSSCINIIVASRELEGYRESIKHISDSVEKIYGGITNMYELNQVVMNNTELYKKVLKPLGDLSKFMPPLGAVEALGSITKIAKPLQETAKVLEPLGRVAKQTDKLQMVVRQAKPLQEIAEAMEPMKQVVEKK